MSEYQYYEFQAIDRPLSEAEMRVLRSYSTRARITSTSFVNDYEWGNFKGDQDAWMEKYFDAFLYVANWGTRVFMLRLPSTLLDLKTARRYCCGESASVREMKGKIVLTFALEDAVSDDVDMGESWLSSLIPPRSDLARGDPSHLVHGLAPSCSERVPSSGSHRTACALRARPTECLAEDPRGIPLSRRRPSSCGVALERADREFTTEAKGTPGQSCEFACRCEG